MSNLAFVGNKDRFIARSNKRKPVYLGGRWCKNHPASMWGKMSNGEYYAQCAQGFRTKTACEIGE